MLRHDVDLSMEKAAELAELEKSLSVKSTYFVMLSSDGYNLFSKSSMDALLKIIDNGHEIGLHFDIEAYDLMFEIEFEMNIIAELAVLDCVLQEPVRSISWHIPDESLIGRTWEFLDRLHVKNVYDELYFDEYRYCSDSNMNWRTNPYEFMDTKACPKIQLLTHPIWYSLGTESSKKEIRDNILLSSEEQKTEYLSRIIRF